MFRLPSGFGPGSKSSNTSDELAHDRAAQAWYAHKSAPAVNTNAVISAAIRSKHSNARVTIVDRMTCNLFGYANGSGKASYKPIIDPVDPLAEPLIIHEFLQAPSRLYGQGYVTQRLQFGKFSYSVDNQEYILYAAEARDGTGPYPDLFYQYLVHEDSAESESAVQKLILDAGHWSVTLHNEIWIFDQGFWQKDAGLYNSIMKSSWDSVILDEDEKAALRSDVQRFFKGRARYERYGISWKRGIIYYGPPGNGKTISIKALMHELYTMKAPIPTLYVKTLTAFAPPEYSLKNIFAKARQEAPCLLVFEDLDSIVTDRVRSYFLNEVDGLKANDGVYMIGSTNHLDRLDPGISKRPSRFDRKFLFPKPDFAQRVKYCQFWRTKLLKAKTSSVDNRVAPSDKNVHPKVIRYEDFVAVDGDNDIIHVNLHADFLNNESLVGPQQKPEEKKKDSRSEDFDDDESSDVSGENDDDDDDDDDDDQDIEFPLDLCPEIAKITDNFSFAYLQEAFVATLLTIAGGGAEDHEKPHETIAQPGRGFQAATKDKYEDLLFWRVIKKQVELLKEQI